MTITGSANASTGAIPEQQISRLRVPEHDELTDASRRLLSTTQKSVGHVPNWLSAFAIGGADNDRLNAYLFPLLTGGSGRTSSITLREREIIATVVSVENRCGYCHPFHIDSLAQVLGDYQLATRIGLDYREVDELTDRERALAELTTVLTHTPRDVTAEQIDHLRQLGLGDEEIFEALQIIAIIGATNRLAIALAVVPDRELFAAQDGRLTDE